MGLAMNDVISFLPRRFFKIAFGLVLLSSAVCHAQEVLFEENFSGEVTNAPNPVWSWNRNNNILTGMMVGEGDIYSLHEGGEFVSHRRSLRMDFSGRNGFCNVCGGDDVKVLRVEGQTACVNAPDGPYEDYVYNKTNNFSTWRVTSATASEVCLDTSSPIKSGVYGIAPSVSVGDEIFLPKVCGKNGIIGGDISRKSDCNKAVNYLQNVSSDHFGYGDTLSRRFYFYIDENAVLPGQTLKLGYTHWQRPGQSVRPAQMNISVQRDMTFSLLTPDGQRVVVNEDDSIRFQRNTWYYVEEVFKRESSSSSSDASYTLYAAKAGLPADNPIVHIENFVIGELKDMSIGGNWQHHNDVSGYVYFDNIRIAKGYSGPVNRPVIEPEN